MTDVFALYIDGEFIGSRQRDGEPVENPATGETLGILPHATAEDLDWAIAAASRSFGIWRSLPAYDRSIILRRAADLIRARSDEIAAIMTREQGKPLAESRGEVMMSADIFDWAAEEGRRTYGRIIPGRSARTRQLVLHEPVGPCALFTPWNFPALTPARKLAAALAAGCTAIIKAAEETPGTAVAIVRALHDAGLPKGVVNLVFGNPAAVSAHLIADRAIRKISFTGSTPVGKHLIRLSADGVKRTTMELGGNAPVIVCADADIEQAVRLSVNAKFRNAGQVCIAPSRFFVHESIHDHFVKNFLMLTSNLRVGNGLDEGVQMGALANGRRVTAMETMVSDATSKGARLRAGGERLANRGHFFAPTVLTDVPADAQLMCDETFGPIAPISRFSDLESVIARANEVEAGLAAYAFARDRDSVAALTDNLEAGMVGINGFAVSMPETPFGGVKESGHGQEGGAEGIHAYLNVKFVSES